MILLSTIVLFVHKHVSSTKGETFMLLSELTKASSSSTDELGGTYAAAKLSSETKKQIRQYMKNQDILHPEDPDDMHCTILYSRKPCPDYKAAGKYDEPIPASVKGFEIWPTRDMERNVLVLNLTCKGLTDRHNKLMDEHKASYDFPEYKPHVTFSYDFGDGDAKDLPPYKGIVEFDAEYQEDLNNL